MLPTDLKRRFLIKIFLARPPDKTLCVLDLTIKVL